MPDNSVLVINKVDGTTVTVTIPWVRSGLPLTSIDPVLSPMSTAAMRPVRHGISSGVEGSALTDLQTSAASFDQAVLGIGSPSSVFNPPPGFTLRLGSKATDVFISGTFPSGGKTLGFIRIGTYAPADTTAALQQFAAEMLYFQENVDGLVIDQMRNPGGIVMLRRIDRGLT